MRYYGIQNEVKAYLNRLQSENGIEASPSTIKTLNDRVESLKKSGVWSQYGLGFNDLDADSYFQRASVNDVIGRSEVCWFVRGMKALGLWQNMVSWPLRSYQNAGTGSTVYSLGGLGVYDGTLFNSPTWGVDGIETINSSSQTVRTNTPSTLILNTGSLGHIVKPTASFTAPYYNRWFPGANNYIGFTFSGFFVPTLQGGAGSQYIFGINSPNNGLNFESKLFSWNSSQVITNLNSTQTRIDTQTQIPIFNSTGHVLSEGNATNTFGIVLSVAISREVYLLYYNLYKSTLGSNLGLP